MPGPAIGPDDSIPELNLTRELLSFSPPLGSIPNRGTVTQAVLDNPNLVLNNRADAQDITATTVVVIDTSPADPLFGGGTDTIAFLLGDKTAAAPNADAVRMTAIFWIETVSEWITVPAGRPGYPVVVEGDASGGGPAAAFVVSVTEETTGDTEVDVTCTRIQYTQTVFLNLNGLTWPHVSVATLVPNDPVPVTVQAGLPPPAGGAPTVHTTT